MVSCSTHTAAFDHLGIEDGTKLISRTYYTLAEIEDLSPEPTSEFVERVAMALREAYIKEAAVPLVPDPVNQAIDYATDRLVHKLLNDPDADLRTELLPGFYQSIASAYCAHLDAGGTPGDVGISYDDENNDGGIPVDT